jgi:transglutaminase-like putative cysteine protease
MIFGVTAAPMALAATPTWLESDSQRAVSQRTESDFSLSVEQAIRDFKTRYGLTVSESDLDSYAANHLIEMMEINGEKRVYRKSVRNFGLIMSQKIGDWHHRGYGASEKRISFVDSTLQSLDKQGFGDTHEVVYRFTIDVPYDEALDGDTLRVWMPVPMVTPRQKEVKILSTEPKEYVLSDGRSVHNTIYFSRPVEKGKTAHFEYVARFTPRGQYFSPDDILANLKPYDKTSAIYQEYTRQQLPHIIYMSDLAHEIVGEETNPFRQSELVYDYIINNFPWAGAREYSTIPCIPQYVIDEGHGDCGQVSMLYISLMRSLGVPARWESGWMLHPGEKNLHDWAEVYFEGVGWVPVDTSFGRYDNADNEKTAKFYSTGMDAHRLAANSGVCGDFYPVKKFIRSETVDSQLGEVECSRGNLFYPGWKQHLEIIKQTPLTK